MSGLQKILKIHGRVKVGDVYWVWDYANDCQRKESEMTPKEIRVNKKAHKEKGTIRRIGDDKIEWGSRKL